MSFSEPFPFLDLPGELRNAIYYQMFCYWQRHSAFGPMRPNGTSIFVSLRLGRVRNVLLANKQVYQEAKTLLLKKNEFVLASIVATDATPIPTLFFQVPVVAMGSRSVTLFKDLVVMTHSIDFPNAAEAEKERNQLQAILLHQDLHQLCKNLARFEVRSEPPFVQAKHAITIHNPFETLNTEYLNSEIQKRLLNVYEEEFQGIDHFKIEGHVQQDLAKAVVDTIWKEPTIPRPNEMLEDLTQKKELGNQAYHYGDINKALEYWKEVYFIALEATHRRAWKSCKVAGGRRFTDGVTELAFLVRSNQALCYLIDMRRVDKSKPNHQLRLDALLKKVNDIMLSHKRARTIFGTNWKPSREQLGNYYYQKALALRLAGRVVLEAEEFILLAAVYLPDNSLIQLEVQRIAEWKARLLGRLNR